MIAPLLAAEPTNVWEWLTDSTQREITGPIPHNLWLTLQHALGASLIAVLLAVPAAVVLAHYRKAAALSGFIVNLGRVIPTITVVGLAVVVSLRNGFGFTPWPIVFALVLLALPPIYANTYTAVVQVSPEAVGAARAMGMSERAIMTQVELPLALPLVLAGIRVATTQVVATEALGPLFGGDGLGLYVSFGFPAHDNYAIQGGAVLIAGTALAVDQVLALVSRLLIPAGLRRPRRGRRRRPEAPAVPGSAAIAAGTT